MLMQAINSLFDYIDTHFTLYGCVSVLVLLVLLFIVSRMRDEPQQKTAHPDVNAIAGDDLLTTQLDLARAYIEMDNKELAKDILQQVLRQGNATQKREAERLLHAYSTRC